MFNRIPLGSAGRVMCHCNFQAMAITEFFLDAQFSRAKSGTIASSTVCQNQNTVAMRIASLPFLAPPFFDWFYCKRSCVERCAYENCSLVCLSVIYSVGNAFTLGIAGKAMIIYRSRLSSVRRAGVLEVANLFFFLCVYSYAGIAFLGKTFSELTNIHELPISVLLILWFLFASERNFLAIDP